MDLDEIVASANAFLAPPAEERRDPLAHRDGISAFALVLAIGTVRVRVSCASCGWGGYRTGGPWAGEKPCPRCGDVVAIHAIKHRESS